MRVRLLIQVGAYHKEKSSPDADFMKLSGDHTDIMGWVMNDLQFDFKVKDVWKLADGTPHLIEYEAITDVPLGGSNEHKSESGRNTSDFDSSETV